MKSGEIPFWQLVGKCRIRQTGQILSDMDDDDEAPEVGLDELLEMDQMTIS